MKQRQEGFGQYEQLKKDEYEVSIALRVLKRIKRAIDEQIVRVRPPKKRNIIFGHIDMKQPELMTDAEIIEMMLVEDINIEDDHPLAREYRKRNLGAAQMTC